MVDEEAGAAVQQRAEVVKGPGHVEVGEVYMPVLIGSQRVF